MLGYRCTVANATAVNQHYSYTKMFKTLSKYRDYLLL